MKVKIPKAAWAILVFSLVLLTGMGLLFFGSVCLKPWGFGLFILGTAGVFVFCFLGGIDAAYRKES